METEPTSQVLFFNNSCAVDDDQTQFNTTEAIFSSKTLVSAIESILQQETS
jgi:hypothetical protein